MVPSATYKALLVCASCIVLAHAGKEPSGWERIDPPNETPSLPPDTALPFKVLVALKQRNIESLQRRFLEISDPFHPKYKHYLSHDDIAAMVAPPQQSIDQVLSHLRQYFSPEQMQITPTKDTIVLSNVSVSQAYDCFKATMSRFRHIGFSQLAFRSDSYTIPEEISEHIQFVDGLTNLPHQWEQAYQRRTAREHRRQVRDSQPAGEVSVDGNDTWPHDCAGVNTVGMITPLVLRRTYNVPDDLFNSTFGGSIAVSEPGSPDTYYKQSDIDEFFRKCGLGPPTQYVSKMDTNKERVCDNINNCLEASLDMQYLASAVPGVEAQYWMFESGNYLEWMTKVNSEKDAALVHSLSAGDAEANDYGQSGKGWEWLDRVNTEFMKAGTMGKTIVVASGDFGVWPQLDFNADEEPDKTYKFHPGFPPSGAITAVGGSQFNNLKQIGEQRAVQTGEQFQNNKWFKSGSSGGGFSNALAQPAYQKEAVENYLKVMSSSLPPSDLWNISGRGYPDVAILAGDPNEPVVPYAFQVQRNGQWVGVDGTSAAAPTFGSLIALINAHLLKLGKAPLGFLNPLLYSTLKTQPDAFLDIVLGDNNFVIVDFKTNTARPYEYGFNATKGWDPVTGCGGIDVSALYNIVSESKV